MNKRRKLAAIMFTDIVGYTALMGKDEKNALQILEKNRDILKPLIKKYNGKWLKEMGDGTLSSFNSAVEAVYCAKEIQLSLKEKHDFRLRIGIHVGDVLFVKGDVIGDGVNVASRIYPLAEPGGICISERVYYDIRNKPDINTVFIGEKNLKNVAFPIKLYDIPIDEPFVSNPQPFPIELSPLLETKPSIAVLPFTDMSPNKDQEYFCDGMAEEILDALAHVEGLRVIARTSSFSFKGEYKDIRDIGKKLCVDTLLEGSVRKSENKLRITIQFINVADGSHIWSERFDRELNDVFIIQEEISLAIVEKLKVNLLKTEKNVILKRYTDDIEAYEYYLKGRYFWSKRTEEGLKQAVEYFLKAIEIDRDYSLAYTGLADSYDLLTTYSNLPSIEAYPKAKEAALKALHIDNTIAEAHASLAGIIMDFEWNWQEAEKEYKEALKINPGYANAYQWYASLLLMMGKFDEAIKMIKRAKELDPLSIIINYVLAQFYHYSGSNDEAMQQFQKALEIDPYFWLTYYGIGTIHCEKGNYQEAISAMKKAIELSGNLHYTKAALGYTYGISGDKYNAKKILDELLNQKNVSSYLIALLYLCMRENEKVFEYLERAYEERDTFMTFIKVDPEFKLIHSDPRFKVILKKMNFE